MAGTKAPTARATAAGTTATGPSQPVPRSRARRLWLICVLLCVACAGAVGSLSMVWYRTDIGPVTIQDSSFNTTTATAHASIDAWGLVSQDPPPATQAFGTPTMPAQPGSLFSMPTAAALVCIMGLFVLAGTALRMTLICGLGMLITPFAWWQNQQLVATMTNPQTGGLYNSAGPGVFWFQVALMAAAMFATVATVQCGLTNAKIRRERREAALAAGVEPPSRFFDSVWNLASRSLNRLDPHQTSLSRGGGSPDRHA